MWRSGRMDPSVGWWKMKEAREADSEWSGRREEGKKGQMFGTDDCWPFLFFLLLFTLSLLSLVVLLCFLFLCSWREKRDPIILSHVPHYYYSPHVLLSFLFHSFSLLLSLSPADSGLSSLYSDAGKQEKSGLHYHLPVCTHCYYY